LTFVVRSVTGNRLKLFLVILNVEKAFHYAAAMGIFPEIATQ